jgi:hypothetical protein
VPHPAEGLSPGRGALGPVILKIIEHNSCRIAGAPAYGQHNSPWSAGMMDAKKDQ